MHIALDATSLPPKTLGAATYILNLVRALAELGRPVRLTVVAQRHRADQFESIPGLEVLRVPDAPPLARILWEQVALPGLCRRLDVDLLHSPHYSIPLAHPCRSVVTFHDMTFFTNPTVHLQYKRLFFTTMIRSAARRADAILVPSETTREDLARLFPRSASKTHVVHLGVGKLFHPVREPAALEAVRSRYHLPSAFLLYVGNLEPRKNLPRLLAAYAQLASMSTPPPLVLAGPQGWKGEPLSAAVRRLGLADRLIFPGYIAQEDLPALYSMAAVFVYPSLYEGFGLPVLEAMACGAPVVTSDVSSLPEVVGDAALLVSPDDIDGLATTLGRLLSDTRLADGLRRRGLERAREFSWRRTAEATWAVYQKVYEGK